MKRCPKCNYNIKSHYENIVNCPNCGVYVHGDSPFNSTDIRRFELRYSLGWKEVVTKIYQIDIQKIINLLEHSNNKSLSKLFKKFLVKCSVIDECPTDFKRVLPKGQYKEFLEDNDG